MQQHVLTAPWKGYQEAISINNFQVAPQRVTLRARARRRIYHIQLLRH